MTKLEILEAACVETLPNCAKYPSRLEREEQALVAAIGKLDDQLAREDRVTAITYFRKFKTFSGIGKAGQKMPIH